MTMNQSEVDEALAWADVHEGLAHILADALREARESNQRQAEIIKGLKDRNSKNLVKLIKSDFRVAEDAKTIARLTEALKELQYEYPRSCRKDEHVNVALKPEAKP